MRRSRLREHQHLVDDYLPFEERLQPQLCHELRDEPGGEAREERNLRHDPRAGHGGERLRHEAVGEALQGRLVVLALHLPGRRAGAKVMAVAGR